MAQLAEDEFYMENGLMVFTERFHLRRGACCGSGCRHCPYLYEKVPLDRRAQLPPPRPYFTALLALFLALFLTVQAQEPMDLFVRNRPFDGPVRQVGGDMYAPLDDLLRALGCGWDADDTAILIHLGAPATDPRLQKMAPILVEGRPVEVGAGMYQGRLYCSVSALARAVGSDYRVNTTLGTVDIYAPAALPVSEAVDARPVVKAGEQGSQVELTKVSFGVTRDRDNPSLQYLRGYAIITNKARTGVVEGLNVKVEIRDVDGKLLGRFGETLGKLPAGRQVTYQFPAWPNVSNVDLKPRVEVYHLR